MREYKFRAKCIEPLVSGDQWIYGFGVYTPELTDGTKEYWMYADHGIYEIDPETVGQYTGLQDRNRKEIFEGDIIKAVALSNDHCQKGAINIVVVKNYMGNSCLCFNGYESGTPIYPLIVSYEIEVLGNHFDNPELLGEVRE